jgi:hypothetical protein
MKSLGGDLGGVSSIWQKLFFWRVAIAPPLALAGCPRRIAPQALTPCADLNQISTRFQPDFNQNLAPNFDQILLNQNLANQILERLITPFSVT